MPGGVYNWAQGAVLDATDLNEFVANQVIARFSTIAARTAAYGVTNAPALQAGLFSWVAETERVYYYNGTSWVEVGAQVEDDEITTNKILNLAVTEGKIADGAVTNAKLGTITTAGKIANSATTATHLNTGSAIVARNPEGEFSATVVTADLIGAVTGAVTGNVTGNLTGNVTGNVTGIATYTSEWIIGATGTANYNFTGPGFTGAEDDPTLYLIRGHKYKFTNTMGAHPFRIQSTPNGSVGTAYSDGITNNDVSNGTLIWDVQFDTPGNILYYQCTAHTTMGGKIYIVDAGVGTDVSVNTSGTITSSGFVGPLTGNVTGNVTGTATNASKVGNHAVYVGEIQPAVTPVIGDIWFQVTGITPTT